GFDKLVILATEYADHIVVTWRAIYGIGIQVTYINIEVLEIDALEGDDAIDVLSTAPGVATRVIGGLGNDVINVAGDVTGDVFSRDIEGTSGTVNHGVSSDDQDYNGALAEGIDLSVARGGQGMVIIEESAGFSAVYEGGCFLFGLNDPCPIPPGPVGATPVPSIDSYTVALAVKPNCGPGVLDADCKVYITLSAAYPPQSEHPSLTQPYPDDGPTGTEGDTFLFATSHASATGCAVVSSCDFYRQITLNGDPMYVSKRSIVLVFDGTNWNTPQEVYLWAVDDARAEGTRIVTASHSVIQRQCVESDPDHCFDDAVVRNVEVTVYDNDQPGLFITQLDPDTLDPDISTVALEGWGTAVVGPAGHPVTEQHDAYSIVLATAPVGTVVVSITLSDLFPDPIRVCLTSSDVRFSASPSFTDPTNCSPTLTTYTVTFDSTNWFKAVIIEVHGRNDFAPQDPHNTTLTHVISGASTDVAYKTVVPTILERLDAFIIDDENSGVFVLESNGRTLVVACGNAECSVPGLGDNYKIRLNSPPKADVDIAIITDGQTDVDPSTIDGVRLTFDEVGGLQASKAFDGNIRIEIGGTTVIRRVNGDDLGSFLDESFVKGMRIRLSGTGNGSDGDYVVVDLDILTLTVVPAPALPGGTPGAAVVGEYTGVIISQLRSAGVYSGSVIYSNVDHTLVLADGSSWLDHGFLEGQLIKIAGIGCVQGFGSSPDCIFKIQLITGTGANRTDKITLTSAPAGLTDAARVEPDTLPGAGTAVLSIVQWAVVAHFTHPDPANAAQTCPFSPLPDHCGTWYQPITIELLADPFFRLAEGRENLKTFGKQAHLLSGIRGPLSVEGGTTSADRSIRAAVLLPGEDNRPAFRVAAQPPEWQQI
ncbi:MAG TPA: hypothetical protein VGK49_04085, partial [Ilumatobacteraceae bacterium]